MRGYKGYGYGGCTEDYEYEGLDNYLQEVNANKSFLLWKLLLKNIEREGLKFFNKNYSWFYYTQRSTEFDAKFLKTLRQQAWLADKNKNLRKPCDITFSELSDGYIKKCPNIEALIAALKFKLDIVAYLPEEKRQKLEFLEENNLSLDDLKRMVAKDKKKPELHQEQDISDWIP